MPETAQDGLQEWGLPYASDGSITKHIAKFLNSRSVDGVLFTGGTLKPFLIQNCIINLIEKWQKFKPVYLENKKMDLAVSHGASYFGVTSLVDVAKVESSYPRNLFIEVSLGENHKKGLLCILSKGYNGENAIILDQIPLKVILNKAVSFPVSYSLEDSTVKAGDIIIDWKKCETKYKPLASLKTRLHIPSELKKIKKLPSELMISLRVNLSQTGLLSIDCLAKEGHNLPLKPLPSWKLKFSLNENDRNLASDEKVNEAIHSHHIDEQKFKEANEVIGRLYGKANVSNKIEAKPSNLFRDLEKCLGLSRQEWPLHFLRPLWDSLLAGATRRNRSDKHLTSWLSLAGYILRPGYGQQQDVFRVNDLWSAMEDGALNPKAKQAQIQWYIMLRRVAGGLNKEQQNKIYSKIAPAIKKSECGPEAFLLVGSLEYLEMNQKIKLAKMLIKQILAKRPEYLDQKIWALARISSRVPLYGSGETIVRPCFIEAWFEDLKNIDHSNSQYHSLRYFYSQAGRIVDDREFDISNELREKFISCLESMKAKSSLIEPLKSFVPMDDEGKQNLFGEKLPAGFVLEI